MELDHALRGTPYRAQAAGEVLTPFGLLREAVLVEGEDRGFVLVHTQSPEASRAVQELLPRALLGTPLERYTPIAIGPEPGGEGRLSLILDSDCPGLSFSPPLLPGTYAMWWGEPSVFPLTRAAEVWDRWFRKLAGREQEALFEILALAGFPMEEVDRRAPPPDGLVLPVALPSGAQAVLSYREDRGVRIHARREAPFWEVEALLLNLLRLLRKRLPPERPERSPALEWWEEVLKRSQETLTDAVGRVTVGGGKKSL
ncbi:hypothetical protein [Fervidobacterium sp.]